MSSLRVSLGVDRAGPRPPLLLEGAAQVILGAHDPFAGPLKPSATALYGPRSAVLLGDEGPLWVADTGHHRVLGWAKRPTRDDAPADWLLGQPAFDREGRNAGANDSPTAATLNMPCGIAAFGPAGLMVADSWNNRILIWHHSPTQSGVAPDLVLGQADFVSGIPNRGLQAPRADTLHWPFAVLIHQGRLYVADAGNRRILVWRSLPTASGQPADLVLGQPTLEERSDNGGGPADLRSLRWPHDLAVLDGELAVADAGNNRVLLYPLPDTNFAPARAVLGQDSFSQVDHNRGSPEVNAQCLSMPYAVAAVDGELWVADTANSRLLGFSPPFVSGASATALSAQDTFGLKGDNRWQLAQRDSVCWPYGLKTTPRWAVVADTGNNRVLLWPRAPRAAAGLGREGEQVGPHAAAPVAEVPGRS